MRSDRGLDLEMGLADVRRERRRGALFGHLGDETVAGDKLGDLLPVFGAVEARDVWGLPKNGGGGEEVGGGCEWAVMVEWLRVSLKEQICAWSCGLQCRCV